MATKTVSEITINKIRIGGKAPTKIMKGSTEVKKVTKGSTVVYQKEDVTYTLTSNAPTVAATATTITFTVQSYKGSSTAVQPTAVVISGGGSITSITKGSGTTYSIVVKIAANATTATKTHTISISHADSSGTGVQTISANGTQGGNSSTVTYKINYYFCNYFTGTQIQNSTFRFQVSNIEYLSSSVGGGFVGTDYWVNHRTVTFSKHSSFSGSLYDMTNFVFTKDNGVGDWLPPNNVSWQIRVNTNAPTYSSRKTAGRQMFAGVGVLDDEIGSALYNLQVSATTSGTTRYMWFCEAY